MKKFAFLLIGAFALFQTPQAFALPFEDSLNEYQKLIEEIRSKFAEEFPENERIINIYRDTQNTSDEPGTVFYFIHTIVEKEDASFPDPLESAESRIFPNQMSRFYIAQLRITHPFEVIRLIHLSDSMQIENNS